MLSFQSARQLVRSAPRMAVAPAWTPRASFHAGRVLRKEPTDSEESVHAELHHGHRDPHDLSKETVEKVHERYGQKDIPLGGAEGSAATESEQAAHANQEFADASPETLAKKTTEKAQKEKEQGR